MKAITAIAALAMIGCAHADPYSGQTGPTVQQVVVYLSDNTGQTAVAWGNVVSKHQFIGCFAKWEELPQVRCYALTGKDGAIPEVKLTFAVETELLQGKGS